MVCFHPYKGWRSRVTNSSGKRSITFNPKDGYADQPVTVACGQCIGCRLERSRQWAIRCVQEASLYEQNCFITLTYNNKYLPQDKSLNITEFQRFIKRLRKKYKEKRIRYFHCGEYGEKYGRPHYHACLFNHEFEDKTFYKYNNKVPLYRSKILEDLWIDTKTKESLGYSTVGDVTFESAAYVARYIMKKVNGDNAEDHYLRVNKETGEYWSLTPEYTTMSRRPGVGKEWYEEYKTDCYPDDFVVLSNGKKYTVPRAYDKHFELEEPREMAKIKAKRRRKAEKHVDNNSPLRRRTRERIQQKKLDLLKRNIDHEG